MSGPADNQEFEGLARQLRNLASFANETFDRHPPQKWRRVLRSRLRKLKNTLTAADVLLFRVSCRRDTDPYVRPLGRATKPSQEERSPGNQRFAFRLLPADIQDCLTSKTAVRVSHSNGAGGRLLRHLQAEVDGNEAIVLPLFRGDGRLTGLLVLISCEGCDLDFTSPQMERFTELLRLNGLMLLTNVQRQRSLTRQERAVEQWRRIADHACDFAIQINRQQVIVQVIPFGKGESYPPVKGLRLTDVVDRTFHRRMKQQILLALQDGSVRTIEFRLSLGAEPSTWYQVRIEPLQHPADGDCMLYLTDNNQDKRLQSEINLLNEQLVRASRLSLLGQMSTEFAHQLNQPLQAILGFCNLTLKRIRRQEDTPEKTLSALEQIETSVTHAANIIGSIREFARHRSLNIRRVPVAHMLDDAIMMVNDRASRMNGEFIVHDLPKNCEVLADRTQSTHVFINLFVNALEAISEFGVDHPLINIRIEDVEDSNRVVVAIKDNGPGLPTVDQNQVFEKFHTQKKDGLGLGLTISRDVCEAQQGSLTALNNEREPGCTFYVAFKAVGADPADSVDDEDTI